MQSKLLQKDVIYDQNEPFSLQIVGKRPNSPSQFSENDHFIPQFPKIFKAQIIAYKTFENIDSLVDFLSVFLYEIFGRHV